LANFKTEDFPLHGQEIKLAHIAFVYIGMADTFFPMKVLPNSV